MTQQTQDLSLGVSRADIFGQPMLSAAGGMLAESLTDGLRRRAEDGRAKVQEVEMLYDPQLDCYYDPRTGKYFKKKAAK
jgi:hypothetical protein